MYFIHLYFVANTKKLYKHLSVGFKCKLQIIHKITMLNAFKPDAHARLTGSLINK